MIGVLTGMTQECQPALYHQELEHQLDDSDAKVYLS